MIERNVTKTDEIVNGCTVRRIYENSELLRIEVFNKSGWRIGTYKTERGALRAANRQS